MTPEPDVCFLLPHHVEPPLQPDMIRAVASSAAKCIFFIGFQVLYGVVKHSVKIAVGS